MQSLKNDFINIYGDGNQTRSFCFVDDLVKGLFKLMNSNYSKPVNLGNPEEYTINEVANKIRNKINPNIKFNYKEMPEDDPLRRKPDISLALQNLEWKPLISFDEGLEKTINYFKEIVI